MIISSNQPYFCPYFPYFQLIYASDLFIIADDYAFIKDGWIHRNNILQSGQPCWFRIPIQHASSFSMINALEVGTINIPKVMRQIELSYHRAPYYQEGKDIVSEIITYNNHNLVDFLEHSLHIICDYMSISTPFSRTSYLLGNNNYKREFRVYDMCQRYGADTFVNAIGGQSLYSFDDFSGHGIKLAFIDSKVHEYKQFSHPFVPNLSVIDVIMFNSKEQIKLMLGEYSLNYKH